MKCPNCDADLLMTERLGVEIDYCPQCRGIWLDRGELDKMLERSSAEYGVPNTPPLPRSDSPRPEHGADYRNGNERSSYDRGQGQAPRKKKSSLIMDLFEGLGD